MATQDKSMYMRIIMVSLKKHAKLILPKTLLNLAALTFKNARIALLQQEQNPEMKEIAGLKRSIQFGRSLNMEQFVELIK